MESRQQRLRIAVQKSGRLTDDSLDLLHSCGLKFSRGKDQLMCYGENMPLDVLFVRDDDIPDLVQEDVCDLGIVGLNVIEEKRLAMASRGAHAPLRTAAAHRLRPLPALARRAARLPVRRPAQHCRPAHRDDLPATSSRVSCARIRWKPKSSRFRAPSRSRRASAART